MTTHTRLSYVVTRTEAAGYTPVRRKIRVGAYASLSAAIAGSRREYAARPDDTIQIRHEGRIVRCLYHHGLPPSWELPAAERARSARVS